MTAWFAHGAVQAAAESFLPTDISDLELWFDAADSSTITDVSGEVTDWADKSANGEDIDQTTASERPNTAAINTNDSIEFDGNDVLQDLAATATFNANPSTIACVFTVTDTLLTDDLLRLRDSSFRRLLSVRQVGDDIQVNQGHTGNTADLAVVNVLANNETRWVIGRFENGTQNVITDEGNTASDTVATLSSDNVDDIIIGGSTPTGDFVGHIHEVIVYSKVLSDSERTQLTNYLNSKWTLS